LTVADMPTRVAPAAILTGAQAGAGQGQRTVLPPLDQQQQPQVADRKNSNLPRVLVAVLLVAVLAGVAAIALHKPAIKPVREQTVQAQISGTRDLIDSNRQ